MNSTDLQRLAIAGAILYAAYRFGPAWAKGAVLSIAAVGIARRVPYLNAV